MTGGCPSGKQVIRTWKMAQEVARRQAYRDRRLGRSHVLAVAYHCADCGAFHVTSNPWTSARTPRRHWW